MRIHLHKSLWKRRKYLQKTKHKQIRKHTHTQSTARCSARETKVLPTAWNPLIWSTVYAKRRLRICLSCPFQCEATSEVLIELARRSTSQLDCTLRLSPHYHLFCTCALISSSAWFALSLQIGEREHIPVRPDRLKTLVYIFSIKLFLPAINS